MNNYEQRKFLDYFYKLINYINFKNYTFDEVFNFFLEEFKVDPTQFKLNKYGDIEIETQRQKQAFINTLTSCLLELKKKIPVRNTILEKQFLIIKNIYKLSNEEYELMQYFAFKELNSVFEKFFNVLERPNVADFARGYINLRNGKRERILYKLYLKNITDNRYNGDLNLMFLNVFDNPKCNTRNKIISTLIGGHETTNLTLKDYEHLKPEAKKVIKILSAAAAQKRKGVNILLYGSVGTGKTEFAKLIAKCAKIPMYSVITHKSNFQEPSRDERLVDLYSKQNLLMQTSKSCILFDEGEDVMNRGFMTFQSASKGYLNHLLESTSVPVIWTTNDIYRVDPAFLRRMTYCIEFEPLSEDVRLKIWNKAVKKHKLKVSRTKIEELNKNYNIPPSLITNAVETVKMLDGNEDDFEDLIENVAKVVTKRKDVKNKKGFELKKYSENLVNTDCSISDLTQKIKQSGNLNFSLCLYGEPGTGKSLYARYLAKQLGVDIIMKRASDLISPYVGETEQNIAAAFAESKSQKAMLIFDEADTFLQNRNNAVRSWEVAQVNEMLTWMESHELPFVCTTNLLDTLDEASLRRFTFKIKFNFLATEQVNSAIEYFFGIKDANVNIKGLTAGDFATVKKKADFLKINDKAAIVKMLEDEVKIKKTKELNQTVGF